MENRAISRLVSELVSDHGALLAFFGRYEERAPTAIGDFVAGNPQEMPLPGFVAALSKWLVPRSKDHFAYKMSVPEAPQAVVASLASARGLRLPREDIIITSGALRALAASLRGLCDNRDEINYLHPP